MMFLASCAYMLGPLLTVLRKNSIPFHNPYRKANGVWNPLRLTKSSTASRIAALLAGQAQSEGGRWWTRQELELWTECLRPGIVQQDARDRLPYIDPQCQVPLECLREVFVAPTLESLLSSRDQGDRALISWLRNRVSLGVPRPRPVCRGRCGNAGPQGAHGRAAGCRWDYPFGKGRRSGRGVPVPGSQRSGRLAVSRTRRAAGFRHPGVLCGGDAGNGNALCVRVFGRERHPTLMKRNDLPVSNTNAMLLVLTGGVGLPQRVQHPKVNECRDRGTPYWFFRYREDQLLPDGTIKTLRKRHIVGPSKGPNAIGKKQAELERDQFLAGVNAISAV